MPQEPLNRPAWQLPDGVSRGAWDYANTDSIATEYDQFHRDHPLLTYDQEVIGDIALKFEKGDQVAPPSAPVAIDLGCGTGRSILPLARRGWKTIGVDLSLSMLKEVRAKASQASLHESVATIQGNMVQLEFLKKEIADLLLCMYSSFGMIRGRENRARVLANVARILKPSGLFVIHVHNRGTWIRDPKGIPLTIEGWWKEARRTGWELGDRIYAYRGLPNMFLHIFSRRELERELMGAHLQIEKTILLNRHSSGPLSNPLFLPHLRAGGFIAICRRKAPSNQPPKNQTTLDSPAP